MYKFTITNDSITVIVDGKPVIVREGAANFDFLRAALVNKDWASVPGNLTATKSLKSWLASTGSTFQVNDAGVIFYNSEPLPEAFAEKIHEMVKRGESPLAMVNFYARLQKNPSHRSVHQLWAFLGQLGIPLTDDGCFLAYKKVRDNLFDWHSNTIKNDIGAVIKMPRNKISDDPDHACHEGLHVGALAYARDSFHSGLGRLVIVKVDPENVVSVPHDSSCMKMRVCEYVVYGHFVQPLDNTKHEEEFEDDEECSDEDSCEGENPDCECKDEDETPPVRKKHKFDDLSMGELLEQPIMALRKYAGHSLKLVGASKIPGGKSALIKRILKVR